MSEPLTEATKTPSKNNRDFARPAAFVAELYRLDRGKQADLRRSISDDEGAYWLTGLLHRTDYHGGNQAAARLVAGLFALKPSARDDGEPAPSADDLAKAAAQSKSLAAQLAQVHLAQNRSVGKGSTEQSSTEQRFLGLLDADRYGLPYHLRQAVQLVQGQTIDGKRLQPDWVRLLDDVTYWGEKVRRRWADDFYRQIYRSKSENDTEASTETAE